jgi:peptide/nickel transport system ATP-binding protein/oligopeptide transport system ATP-binding protein
VGESGCGKSATALSIMRLLPRQSGRIKSGEVVYGGENLVTLDNSQMRQVRGKKISMIFQDPMTSLNPVLRVGDQIVEAILLHEKLTKGAARDRAIEMLTLVGIPDPAIRVDNHPYQMSGGMRQRVMIALALACRPDVLLADEPTTALDVTVQAQILDLIAGLQAKLSMGILLITHDLGVVAQYTNQVAVMYGGRIVERARTGDLFRHPLHPYTRGLMASIPGQQERKTQINAIPGTVPSALNWPNGCRFRSRCPAQSSRCAEESPALSEIRSDHWVACFNI